MALTEENASLTEVVTREWTCTCSRLCHHDPLLSVCLWAQNSISSGSLLMSLGTVGYILGLPRAAPAYSVWLS